mmetsp:Transcript_4044/g.10355  ORF Transcript_4044/g.10355 Transcript_4044/m.10355 type:complete len:134 (+) Transcript_4044:550-951(+)
MLTMNRPTSETPCCTSQQFIPPPLLPTTSTRNAHRQRDRRHIRHHAGNMHTQTIPPRITHPFPQNPHCVAHLAHTCDRHEDTSTELRTHSDKYKQLTETDERDATPCKTVTPMASIAHRHTNQSVQMDMYVCI